MTRAINITVPENRCTDEWWSRYTPEIVADAIEMMGKIFASSGDDTAREEKIRDLENRLNGTNAAVHSATEALTQQLDTHYSRRLEEKDQMIQFLTNQCEQQRSLLDQACQNNDTVTSALREQLLTKPDKTCTINEAGEIAEIEVEQLITDTLACEVENTSRETAMGDRFVTTPDGLKMMVEVKNVDRLHSKHDIEKFKRDVYHGVESSRINAALLLSLKSKSIPNVGGACNITFINGKSGRVPVVMLASNSRTTIQLAMRAIEELQKIAEREMSACGEDNIPYRLEALEKERQILIKTLPSIFTFIHEADVASDIRIDMLQRLLYDAESERQRHKDVSYHILKLQQSIPWLATVNEGKDEEVAISIISKWFGRKGKYPKTSELTQPQRVAVKNAGGMAHVVAMCKRKRNATEGGAAQDDEDVLDATG